MGSPDCHQNRIKFDLTPFGMSGGSGSSSLFSAVYVTLSGTTCSVCKGVMHAQGYYGRDRAIRSVQSLQ